jgi:hypothetical protein
MKRKQFSQEQLSPLGWVPFQQQQQQTLSILGGTGYLFGVELVETGGNCESFEVRYYPEVNEDLAGIGGEVFLTAKSQKFARDITGNMEVNAASGWALFTLSTACSFANDVATFGDGSGTILLDEATERQARGSWRSLSISAGSKPNRVVT